MRWTDIEPVIAENLRKQRIILAGTILGVDSPVNNPIPFARRYMKLLPEFNILDFQQSKNHFLFHLSRQAPRAYKTAFEFLFRVELGESNFHKSYRQVALTPFVLFMIDNGLPLPIWIAEILVDDQGPSMLLPFVSRTNDENLFELARLFRSRLPDPDAWSAASKKNEFIKAREQLLAGFGTELAKRQDAWGSVNPILFWNMIP